MMVARRWFCALALWGMLAQPGQSETQIHFSGRLIAGTCNLVVTGDNLAEVVFPPISANTLTARRQSDPVPFSVQLNDCAVSVKGGVAVAFSGAEVSGMPGFLALSGQSAAKGIGIGIETQTGTQVRVNDATGSVFPLTEGLNTLSFNAWIQAVNGETVTPGTFFATTTVAFEYL